MGWASLRWNLPAVVRRRTRSVGIRISRTGRVRVWILEHVPSCSWLAKLSHTRVRSKPLNALPIRVCPQCQAAQVVLGMINPPVFPHIPPCTQPPVNGTWVSEGGWPAYIDAEGQVTSNTDAPDVPDVGDEGADVPTTDDAEVPVQRADGDTAYWDNEQRPAGR